MQKHKVAWNGEQSSDGRVPDLYKLNKIANWPEQFVQNLYCIMVKSLQPSALSQQYIFLPKHFYFSTPQFYLKLFILSIILLILHCKLEHSLRQTKWYTLQWCHRHQVVSPQPSQAFSMSGSSCHSGWFTVFQSKTVNTSFERGSISLWLGEWKKKIGQCQPNKLLSSASSFLGSF